MVLIMGLVHGSVDMRHKTPTIKAAATIKFMLTITAS
jgi:hypothetical protein